MWCLLLLRMFLMLWSTVVLIDNHLRRVASVGVGNVIICRLVISRWCRPTTVGSSVIATTTRRVHPIIIVHLVTNESCSIYRTDIKNVADLSFFKVTIQSFSSSDDSPSPVLFLVHGTIS